MAQPAGIARNVVDENNWTPVARKAMAGMKIYKRPQATYLLGAVIVWAGLIAAMAVILGGTPHFGEIVPILFVGAFYFTVIAPLGIWPTRALPSRPRGAQARRGRRPIGQLVAPVRGRLYLFGLLGLIGLLGVPFDQPILFLFFLLFGLFGFAPKRSADTHPRPRWRGQRSSP